MRSGLALFTWRTRKSDRDHDLTSTAPIEDAHPAFGLGHHGDTRKEQFQHDNHPYGRNTIRTDDIDGLAGSLS